MNKYDQMLFAEWLKERNEALLSFDIDKFKEFYYKWVKRGFYCYELPNDDILEISIRKAVLGISDAPDWAIKEAEQWLIDHNYDPEF